MQRPVECSHCQKAIRVCYKEIVGDTIACTEMCGECPVLQKRLYGEGNGSAVPEGGATGLCCHRCGTTLEMVKMGNALGCLDCYEVFAVAIAEELIKSKQIPLSACKAFEQKKPLHLGKTPRETKGISISDRISSLNEELNDAIRKENYEQAAWLRDQIKELMEKNDE